MPESTRAFDCCEPFIFTRFDILLYLYYTGCSKKVVLNFKSVVLVKMNQKVLILQKPFIFKLLHFLLLNKFNLQQMLDVHHMVIYEMNMSFRNLCKN